ncbi:Stealth CR1 domain-containing protein [Sandarakinorhabdus limnophila]|uniref:Stealth CR1 domain-containing protein n=1 Tax=Sandarakinorhabdus limnophila TaxID=210512 RepID=UPI0026F32257|nr:Stealth CR1 domain-containing protein [Sandarakinorhabdus limnophila]MCM0031772.1 Stealth CR1 domain-containing protein [Sandarakinorhabdus limnophila]
MQFIKDDARIDAVITWVDGDDPAHIAKRLAHQPHAPRHANAVNPHRWACNDELGYCLRSIANHAPWIGRIWIITDAQTPDLSRLPADLVARVRIVDHLTLFAGHQHALPTFNSLAIETLLWRIPGLAERFVYFNDDVFLTGPLAPGDVFQGAAPVLRGAWVDQSAIAADPASRDDPALLNALTQINAAALAGFGADRLFRAAHVVHPLRRSVLARLYDQHRAAFVANLGHRFRCVSQFLPQGLHNHACIAAGVAVLHTEEDHLHLRTGAVLDYPLPQVRAYLARACQPQFKFLCVNDLPQVEAAIPDTRAWIERAIAA